ncbi:hypothetical protein ANO14919_099100 [Xylariales sp. No.14919]|nr:hypothetical protein ANO14919_099100 [Xylariales sp. No.14919]
MAKFLDTIGVGFTYARTLPSLLENAGLDNVQHKSFVIEYGAACPDETLGAKGISHLLSTSVGMLAFLKGIVVFRGVSASRPQKVYFLVV